MLGCDCGKNKGSMSGLGLGFFYEEIWGGIGPIERAVVQGSAMPGYAQEEGYSPSAESLELQAWPYAAQTGYQQFDDIPDSALLGLRGMGMAVPGIPKSTTMKVAGLAILGVAAAAAIYLYTTRRRSA